MALDLDTLKSPGHQGILCEIDKGIDGNAELTIPDDATPKQLLTLILGFTEILSRGDKRKDAVIPLMGKALWMVRDSREFLDECGYTKIGDFMEAVVLPRVGRSTAYAVSVIWKTFPDLPNTDAVSIGHQTLITAAKVVGEHPHPGYVEKVLAIARSSESNKDFKKKLAEAGNIVEGSMDTARITISGPVPDINDLREHLSDPRFQRWALEGQLGREDFKDAHLMILAAIEHSISEWPEEEQPDIPPHGPIAQDGGPGGW